VLFVLFSPGLYILGYIYGWVTAVLGFMASLEVRAHVPSQSENQFSFY
jgi:hypothetical protein